jgi:tetratricopeptide (TPR) repeat protein
VLAHGIDFDSVFDSLLRKDLLQPAQTGSVDVLRFKHLLIRDAAYMSLPRLRRAELHEQFAHFVERSAGGRLAEVEEIVAYHLEQAHRERTAVAPGDPDARMLAAEAGRHAHAAGARASARGDIPAAIVLLERASGLLRAGGEDDLETTFELAVALKESGDVVRVEGLFETTLKRAVAAGDTRLEWCARLELSALAADKGLDITAEMLLDEAAHARRVFETLGDELGVARSWQRVGVVHGVAGRCELARDAFERAREHARSGGGQREERIASQPLFYCLAVGPTPAGEAIERAQELLEEVHLYLGVELVAVAAVAHLCAMQGRFDEARALLARSDAIADELGETISKLQATFYSSQVAALAGDLASAERQLRAAADYAERAGHTGYLASVAEYLAEVVHRRGDNEEAERLTRLSEASAREDDVLAQIGWRVVRAKLLADRGEIDAALELGHDAVGLARRTDAPNVRGAAFLALAHVLRRADRDSDGAAAEGEAVDAFLTKGNTVQASSIREPTSTSPLSSSAS